MEVLIILMKASTTRDESEVRNGRDKINIVSCRKKKDCVKGESNPQLNLGRVPCYHYTINAVADTH